MPGKLKVTLSENPASIYLPSCLPKSVCLTFFCGTFKKDVLNDVVVDFQCMNKKY